MPTTAQAPTVVPTAAQVPVTTPGFFGSFVSGVINITVNVSSKSHSSDLDGLLDGLELDQLICTL